MPAKSKSKKGSKKAKSCRLPKSSPKKAYCLSCRSKKNIVAPKCSTSRNRKTKRSVRMVKGTCSSCKGKVCCIVKN